GNRETQAYQDTLQERYDDMKKDLEATTKRDSEVGRKLKLYSIQLSHQADRISEMRAHISELEAQLSCHTEEVKRLRVQSSGVAESESRTETRASVPILADEAAIDSSLVAF